MTPKNSKSQTYEYFQIDDGDSDFETEGDPSKELLVSPLHKVQSIRFHWTEGWKWFLLIGVFVLLVISSCLLIFFSLDSTEPLRIRQSKAYQASVLGNYSRAAVAIDGEPCARIAKDVLLEGGTAVDAAIAGMFCNGVYNSQSMGLGGGFMMTIYSAKDGKVESLDARETAPGAASSDMFQGDGETSQHGPLSVAVPGEAAGYWEAKQRYGNKSVTWRRLVEPTVKMCREGIPVSWTHDTTLHWYNFTNSKMRSVFHDPKTGKPWIEGDIYTRHDFADTLEKLADAGDRGEENLGFYTGPIGEDFLSDLQKLGGIMTKADMQGYRVHWVEPAKVHLSSLDMTFYSIPPPVSGAIMAYILNIIDNYNFGPEDDGPLLYHRVTEAFKWGFALRTELGDPLGDKEIRKNVNNLVKNLTSDEWATEKYKKISDKFTVNNASYYGAVYYTPVDHGTAHVSVIAPNGDAVSATSTINLYFGSLLMSEKTGIIYNDEMDDFSVPNITNYFGVPPSPSNFIKGGKRPLSSMCPSIVVGDDGQVKLAIGAAGGTKIITATALAIVRKLWLKQNLKEAIDTRRIHHQLAPMQVSYEPDTDKNVLDGLEGRGHLIKKIDKFGSVVVGVERGDDGRIYANADFRKAGGVDGY